MKKIDNDLRFVIIPFIKELIDKEQTHLKFLEDKKDELKGLLSENTFSTLYINIDIEGAIKISRENLTHYKLRLEQYKSYL